MDILKGLNEKQKEAAIHKEGALLIVAGAGAGKTKTLAHRMVQIIKEGTAPQNILAITFTNKAAKEMRDRVESLLDASGIIRGPEKYFDKPFVSTFHSLGVHILRENGKHINIPKHFTILDQSNTLSTTKEAIKQNGLDPKQFEPRKIHNIISKQKNELITLADFSESAGENYFHKIVAEIWEKYDKMLTERKALDFDDLIQKTVQLLQDKKELCKIYQNRWKYIHIDEYQDTNKAQYKLSKLLTDENKNICVVGDVDQNIYSWRGANIKNLLSFEKDYPDATTILLEQNYRSTQTILNVANQIIKKNKVRVDKNLFTKNKEGDKIALFDAFDEGDEARFVAHESKTLIDSGVEPNNIAVLYRANFQSRALEEAFLNQNIPYQVLGVKFFERKEVKDVLSYIQAALNPDSLYDIKRTINVPTRGIGKVTLARIFAKQEHELTPKMRERVTEFYTLLSDIQKKAETTKTSDLIKFVLKRSGVEEMLQNSTDEDQERLENLRELASLAIKYDILSPLEGVEKLLSDAALASDQDSLEKNQNAVKLMTVHAAKGLEFPYVFITGLEQDLFPHHKFDEVLSKEAQEEERRLFYVALTRAEEKLYLTLTSMR
ncbi:MAG: UvrD-helicase domain-containing protein, partial [Candidatus Pacebacteria bacterium]|nr:UvrD-helicase domain-containing protein [Candidatus Paceibacterota bacterium]